MESHDEWSSLKGESFQAFRASVVLPDARFLQLLQFECKFFTSLQKDLH